MRLTVKFFRTSLETDLIVNWSLEEGLRILDSFLGVCEIVQRISIVQVTPSLSSFLFEIQVPSYINVLHWN